MAAEGMSVKFTQISSKKGVIILVAFCITVSMSNAQTTIGTSTSSKTDFFGNSTTTHQNSYGRTEATSTTGKTDYWGNTTTHKANTSGAYEVNSTRGSGVYGTYKTSNGTTITTTTYKAWWQ